MSEKLGWTTERALELCRLLEPVVSKHGAHVGLTGGTLYGDGERGDVDVILYPHWRDISGDLVRIRADIEGVGIATAPLHGRVMKARTEDGGRIDFIVLGSPDGYSGDNKGKENITDALNR